jgi:hypothetical protein
MLGIDRQNAGRGKHEPGAKSRHFWNPAMKVEFKGGNKVEFKGGNKEELYEWVNQALQQLHRSRMAAIERRDRIVTGMPYGGLAEPLRRVHSSLRKEAEPGARWDRGSGCGLLAPVEHTHRAQRVPPAGPTVAVLERKVDLAGMRVLQQPGAIGLLLGSEQIDRFAHPRVRHIPGRAEVFEGTQHIVVPAGRKRELQPGWVDDFACALTPDQFSFEEVLLTPAPSRDGLRGATGCALVRQQSLQDVDRGRERWLVILGMCGVSRLTADKRSRQSADVPALLLFWEISEAGIGRPDHGSKG